MKEKILIIIFVLILTQSSNNFLNKVIKNQVNNDISTINIAIADDLWHYFSRFSLNN